MRYISLLLTFFFLLFQGCGDSTQTAASASTSPTQPELSEDDTPSLSATTAEVVSQNDTTVLRYQDSVSGNTVESPLLYDRVYENQISVVYKEPLDYPGLIYQSDLEGDLKIGLYTATATNAAEFAEELKGLNAEAGVLFAEPNYRVTGDKVITAAAVNDEQYASQWGLAHIGIEGAWENSKGSKEIVVAVIDTGIDYTHEDLAANIWTNRGETAGNGIDDDQNGLVDDTMGYDFINRDNDPKDDHYHGTHCAGIVGALADNTKGGTGVSPVVSLMPLKVLAANGAGSSLGIFYGFRYAVENGADIISMSLGGYGFSYLSYYGAYYAYVNDLLVVAAAGNEDNNNDRTPVYPASFPFSNIIAVASIGTDDERSWFSNYGAGRVDIAAPGENILSTVPEAQGLYKNLSGTSMATPFVSGVAALVKATDTKLSAAEVRGYILSHARSVPALRGVVATGGVLDANATLNDPDLKQTLSVHTTTPAAGAENVSVTTSVSATFDRLIDPESVTDVTFTVTLDNVPIEGNLSVSGNRVTFTPALPLAYESTYRIAAKKSLKAENGLGMEKDFVAAFTTQADPSSVTEELPENANSDLDGTTNVSVAVQITFTFDSDLTNEMIADIDFSLTDPEGNVVAGKLAYSHIDRTLTFTPNDPLQALTTYAVALKIPSAGISEAYSFTTEAP